jgi:hypothetical protein
MLISFSEWEIDGTGLASFGIVGVEIEGPILFVFLCISTAY